MAVAKKAVKKSAKKSTRKTIAKVPVEIPKVETVTVSDPRRVISPRRNTEGHTKRDSDNARRNTGGDE